MFEEDMSKKILKKIFLITILYPNRGQDISSRLYIQRKTPYKPAYKLGDAY